MYINAEKTIYRIQDAEAGNKIADFNTLEEAETELINFESADRTDGIYTPDFYEIVKIEEA